MLLSAISLHHFSNTVVLVLSHSQPATVKENAIVEKTAHFVSKHGAQMEIVIKTKQQNNPHFEFLHFNHVWNPYYKHVVRMIKSGLYKPQVEARTRKRTESPSEEGQWRETKLQMFYTIAGGKEEVVV